MADHDTIVIRAPLGTKARWVHAAQRHRVTLARYVLESVDRPANRMAKTPCVRCHSVLLASDGQGLWQCAQCGLVA